MEILSHLAEGFSVAFLPLNMFLAVLGVFIGTLVGMLPGIGPIHRIIKVTVVFALLVVFSTWWLKRFRFGPFEWLWRSLTYWKLQPMRVGKVEV